MKYLVIGAGGTGGAIGGFLARAGKDVTLIARGAHLAKMQAQGLKFETPEGEYTVPVQACTMEDYQGTPDVIFVCVKGYSLEDTIPFIERVASKETIVIPIFLQTHRYVLSSRVTLCRLTRFLPRWILPRLCSWCATVTKMPCV